jgi:hypothetical protein
MPSTRPMHRWSRKRSDAGAALGDGITTVLNLPKRRAIIRYGPPEVVGPPRQFHVDKLETSANVVGLACEYIRAMADSSRRDVSPAPTNADSSLGR